MAKKTQKYYEDEILYLRKCLEECEEKLVAEQERSERFLKEIRLFESDTDRQRWLIDHLVDYSKDIERIAKE